MTWLCSKWAVHFCGGLAILLCCGVEARAAESLRFDDRNLRAAIQMLSSDEFSGRAPATEGGNLTTNYLAKQFERYRLMPANRGSYFQDVPLMRISGDAAGLTVHAAGGELALAYGEDIAAKTSRPQAVVSLEDSPLIFAGYGIVAPEYHWNDYAGLDVKGKTVVVLVNDPGYATGDPRLFRGKSMTYYGRWTYKYEQAGRLGAAAVLIVHDSGAAGYPWQVVRNGWTGAHEELRSDGGYRPLIEGWVSREAARRVLGAAGLNLDTLAAAAARPGFKPIDLKMAVSFTLHNRVQPIVSRNVVGFLRGTRRPEEVVVYSAHWDHLGTKTGPRGNVETYHGAVDNASGIAGLLELARVYGQDEHRPARSVLFIATSSEEQNLLGAVYYVNHPLFKLADTVADLNMDMMNVYGKTRDLTVWGELMSSLDDDLRQAALSMGLEIVPDAQPEKGYYFRADHFAFARAGIPALTIGSGTDYVGRPSGWGLHQQQEYISQRYHKPTDMLDPSWDLAGMQQQLEILYRVGRKLSEEDTWPSWYSDSPFRPVREAQRSASDHSDSLKRKVAY